MKREGKALTMYNTYGGGSSNIAHGVFSFSLINHIM